MNYTFTPNSIYGYIKRLGIVIYSISIAAIFVPLAIIIYLIIGDE